MDGDEGTDNRRAIAPFHGELPRLPSNSQNINGAMDMDMSEIAEWMNGLSIASLREVLAISSKRRAYRPEHKEAGDVSSRAREDGCI